MFKFKSKSTLSFSSIFNLASKLGIMSTDTIARYCTDLAIHVNDYMDFPMEECYEFVVQAKCDQNVFASSELEAEATCKSTPDYTNSHDSPWEPCEAISWL